MMDIKDTYKTITSPSDKVLFKDRNSKFFGYAFPVSTSEEVKSHIDYLKKLHHTARHWCYAYKLGAENIVYRVNDDGEPSNSAGQPIYGQIQSFDLTNVLIVVVRYFGGVKLGVGGLIYAYRSAAQMALEESDIIEKTIDKNYLISCDYKHLNLVMRIIKEKQIKVISQTMEMDCRLEIAVRKKDSEAIYNIFDRIYEVTIKPLQC